MSEETSLKIDKMVELYKKGYNKSQIAYSLGMSPSYVGRCLKNIGIDFKDRHKSSLTSAVRGEGIMRNFGIFLSYCRTIILRLTPKEMANKLGVTIYKLNQMEAGLMNLSLTEWLDYIKALEVSPDTVLELIRRDDFEESLSKSVREITRDVLNLNK